MARGGTISDDAARLTGGRAVGPAQLQLFQPGLEIINVPSRFAYFIVKAGLHAWVVGRSSHIQRATEDGLLTNDPLSHIVDSHIVVHVGRACRGNVVFDDSVEISTKMVSTDGAICQDALAGCCVTRLVYLVCFRWKPGSERNWQ